MKKVYLDHLPQFKAFGIADDVVRELEQQEIVAEMLLPDEAYTLLNVPKPKPGAPTVGFLMGREKNYYTVDWNYARALAKTGANIRFLAYETPVSQFMGCHGLVLPGGAFPSPEKFYTDPKEDNGPTPRCRAYLQLIKSASCRGIPMLGICAGAQMIGAMYGLKMHRNTKHLGGEIEHKSQEMDAHKIFVIDPKLKEMLGSWLWTNSRHTECEDSDDSKSELKIFAHAEDGCPEAWGNWDKHILCIQWHPEDGASWGNQKMQAIYNWVAEAAATKM